MKMYTEEAKARLQTNLATIRKAAGWTAADLGELIGVTKQTISNLENNRTPMTKTQYIAIRAILDHELRDNPDNESLAQVINILLDEENLSEEDCIKVQSTIAYITSAKEKRLNTAAITASVAALVATVGVGLVGSAAATPLWIEAIRAAKRKK